MTVIHTHPVSAGEERLQQLKDIKSLCIRLLQAKAPEKERD